MSKLSTAGEKVQKIILPYTPQPYQKQIHESSKRYKVVSIGRRGGKTELLINDTIKKAVTNPGLHWILAPSYKQVKNISWARLKSILRVDSHWQFNEQELSATHPIIKTKIELKGCDNEDSLRGVGLKSAAFDEAAMIKPQVWPEIVRPMLADSRGTACFLSTPKGQNWFYDIFKKQDENWQSWHYPTTVNKYIDPQEIEQARKDMSERMFKQEFMAEFLNDDTGIFKKINQCICGSLQEPVLGRFYVMGVDLAKSHDFTVLTVFDSITRQLVAFERFQNVLWTEQKLRIQMLAQKYNNAFCVIDSTGVGDPIVEDMQRAGLSLYYDGDVAGFKFTNDSKVKLIENLAIAIEQRKITFPMIEVLINELRQYEYVITDGGRIKYNAPDGKFDDCVISLALAVWALRSQLYESQQYVNNPQEEIVDRQGRGERIDDYQETISTGY